MVSGQTGYDPQKKKYVGTWVDSMSPSVMVTEGEFDSKTDTMTMNSKGTDPSGKPYDLKLTTVYKDKNTRVFTMFMKSGDSGGRICQDDGNHLHPVGRKSPSIRPPGIDRAARGDQPVGHRGTNPPDRQRELLSRGTAQMKRQPFDGPGVELGDQAEDGMGLDASRLRRRSVHTSSTATYLPVLQ